MKEKRVARSLQVATVHAMYGAALVGAVLLVCVVLQMNGALQLQLRAPAERGPVGVPTTSNSTHQRRYGAVTIGSCEAYTSSSFPYLCHDDYLDYAHHVFKPGANISFIGPSIVFMHPPDAAAFASLVPTLQHKVVLVSNSNDDQCLPWSNWDNINTWRPHVDAILNSSMVAAWWGPNVVMAHPKLKNLPLGPKWSWRLAYHHSEDESKARLLAVYSKWAKNPADNFKLPKRNLLFVQMTERSSDNAVYPPSRGKRRVAIKAAQPILSQQQQIVVSLNISQHVCADDNGKFQHVQKLEQYLFGMRQYKFVLSPVGKGEDTHRTWEALLAGSIPIVESSVRDVMYEGLPVLILRSWSDLSMQLLQEAYTNFTAVERVKSYQWEKLYAPYYIQQMTSDLVQDYMSAAAELQ